VRTALGRFARSVGLMLLTSLMLACASVGARPSETDELTSLAPTATPAETRNRDLNPTPMDAVIESPLPLAISNQSTLEVTLLVNDQVVGVYGPGDHDQEIDPSLLPPAPWQVEVRSPTGRVLVAMDVSVGDVWSSQGPPGGPSGQSGAANRVDLSCGRIDIWSGPPLGGPPPPASFPANDCEP